MFGKKKPINQNANDNSAQNGQKIISTNDTAPIHAEMKRQAAENARIAALNRQKQVIMQSQFNRAGNSFKFLSYHYEPSTRTCAFTYQGIDNVIFTEWVTFAQLEGKRFNVLDDPSLNQLLDRALFLAFILIGTSYYKSRPTPTVQINQPLDEWQAGFFSRVFQEGLSQFAYENKLTRAQLAHFPVAQNFQAPTPLHYKGHGNLSLQSGGKDSILVAQLLKNNNIEFLPWYVSSNETAHPLVIDNLIEGQKAAICTRRLDHQNLQLSQGLNGHVPVTYINMALALVQAIIMNKNTILTAIGQEGVEPAGMILDLPVNHQWSKTWEAEQLFAEYVHRYISEDINIGSPIRGMSELLICEKFIEHCWHDYGYAFSSCNVANYKQGIENGKLSWCGNCAKCANSYLLFAPFLPPNMLASLFADQDLFMKESLQPIFRGLLGINGAMKPFECVGSVEELRTAYHMKQPNYANLSFNVPAGHFDYRAPGPTQPFIADLFKK